MIIVVSVRVSVDEVNWVLSFMIIRFFWFLIFNYKFYEYVFISK